MPISSGDSPVKLGSFSFFESNSNEWPGDGLLDIQIAEIVYSDSSFIDNVVDTEGLAFEVQQVPAPLPVLGVGIFLRLSRKLRLRSKYLRSLMDK